VRSQRNAGGVLNVDDEGGPLMSEYAGQQFVGIDLHRRRSVVVRTTESGDVLEAIQILRWL